MYQRFFLGSWNLGLEIWVFFLTTQSLNETSLRSRALSPREKQSPELPVIAKIWHQANLKQSPSHCEDLASSKSEAISLYGTIIRELLLIWISIVRGSPHLPVLHPCINLKSQGWRILDDG
jgi:hypothetical protein